MAITTSTKVRLLRLACDQANQAERSLLAVLRSWEAAASAVADSVAGAVASTSASGSSSQFSVDGRIPGANTALEAADCRTELIGYVELRATALSLDANDPANNEALRADICNVLYSTEPDVPSFAVFRGV